MAASKAVPAPGASVCGRRYPGLANRLLCVDEKLTEEPAGGSAIRCRPPVLWSVDLGEISGCRRGETREE